MLLLSCSEGWMQLLVSMLQVQSNDKPGEWAQNYQIPAHVHLYSFTTLDTTTHLYGIHICHKKCVCQEQNVN